MILTMKPSSTPWQPQQQPLQVAQYTDYSGVPETVASYGALPNHAADELLRKSSYEQFFPVKLHIMLSELEKQGLSDVVSWQPHGRAFVVHKQDRFVNEVIPKWFRQTGYASFRRQLNLYGFRRITCGRDKGAYYHELFLRSKCFLADRMERVKLSGPVPKGRKRNAPESEPNFYLMKPLPLEETSTASKTAAAPTTTSSLPSSSSIASSMETSGPSAPQVLGPTALDVLQQQYLRNALGPAGLGLSGLLPASVGLPSHDAQLAQILRPLLEQQQQQQQQEQQRRLQQEELEAQLRLQEQIQILRARLLAQILGPK